MSSNSMDQADGDLSPPVSDEYRQQLGHARKVHKSPPDVLVANKHVSYSNKKSDKLIALHDVIFAYKSATNSSSSQPTSVSDTYTRL